MCLSTNVCLTQLGSKSKAGLLLCLVFVIPILSGQDRQRVPNGLKLQVLSVRVLTKNESHSITGDEVWTTPAVAIRLRLSLSESAPGIHLYTWPGDMVPLGYTIKYSDGGFSWFYKEKGEKDWASSSPGIQPLTSGFAGNWSLLHPGMAVEWEKIDNTAYAGERHAYTIFIKTTEGGAPVEVFSNPVVVPKGSTKY